MKLRLALLIAAAVVTAFAAAVAPLIPFSADVAEYLPPEDEDSEFWLDLTHRFGALDILMVGLEEPGEPLQPESLQRLKTITDRLAESKAEGVVLARSLTNLDTIREDAYGTINTDLLVNAIPSTPEEREALERRVLSDLQAPGSFVSRDLRAYVIIVRASPDTDNRQVARLVRQVVEAERGPMRAIYFGAPFISGMMTSQLYDQLVWLVPVFLVLLLIPLVVLLKRWLVAVVVLLGAGVALVWWLALLQLFDVQLTATASGAALVLLPLGAITYARLAENRTWRGGLALAVLLGAAGVGFALLTFAVLPYLAHFGHVAGVGILAIIICGGLLVWPLLSFVPPTQRRTTAETGRFRPAVGLVLVVLLLAGGAYGAARTRFLISPRDIFSKDDDVGRAIAFFDRHFGGADLLQVSARGDFTRPGDCARLLRLTELLEGRALFSDVRSLAQVLAMLNERFGGLYRMPPDSQALANLWFFLEGNEDIRPLVLEDRTEAMVAARIAPDTHIDPAQWAAHAQKAAEQSALTGGEAANARLKALSDRYGLAIPREQVAAVVQSALNPDPAERARRLEAVLDGLQEWMRSPDSPFEPSPAEWQTLRAALAAASIDPPALARQVRGMAGFADMDYPPQVAGELAATLVTRRKALLLEQTADDLVAKLVSQTGGTPARAFAPRARGVLVDLMDPAYPDEDGLEITVSGFPAVVPKVEGLLLRANWYSALVLLAVLFLAFAALTRRPLAALVALLEALTASVVTFGLGWLLQVQVDSGSAVLYLIPPVAAWLLSPQFLPNGQSGRFASAIALALGAAGLSLLGTGLMPALRTGAVMAIGLGTVVLIAGVSRRVYSPPESVTSTTRS